MIVLTLHRPEALNAISGRTVAELNAALDAAEADDSLALVITGSGRAFCAGADLKAPLPDPAERVREMHRLVLRLANFPKVSVAAINGLAFGGGLELAMSCTLRVAAPGAKLGLPEAKLLKAFPAYGGTQLLPRLVGHGKAMELLLTGLPIESAEALRIGLVNRVAEDCPGAALSLAREASVGGRTAIGLIRRLVIGGAALPLAEGLAMEAIAAEQVSQSEETRAAVRAFAQGSKGDA